MLRDLRQSCVLDLSVRRKNVGGSTAFDSSKRHNDAALNGGISVSSNGIASSPKSWSLNGSTGYLSNTVYGPSTTNTITIGIAFNATSLVNQYIGFMETRSGGLFIGLLRSGSSSALTYVWEGTGDEYNGTGVPISTGVWYFGVVVVSPTAATVYVFNPDGSLKGSWTNTKTHNTKAISGSAWNIGRDPNNTATRYFAGNMTQAMICPMSLPFASLQSCAMKFLAGQPSSIGSPLTRQTLRAAIRRRRLAGAAAATGGFPWFLDDFIEPSRFAKTQLIPY